MIYALIITIVVLVVVKLIRDAYYRAIVRDLQYYQWVAEREVEAEQQEFNHEMEEAVATGMPYKKAFEAVSAKRYGKGVAK